MYQFLIIAYFFTFRITDSTFEAFDISENEIKDILLTLNINKTCGLDLVSHKMLNAVFKPLFIIFNRSLRERHFPEPWKRNNIVALFKRVKNQIPLITGPSPCQVQLVKL